MTSKCRQLDELGKLYFGHCFSKKDIPSFLARKRTGVTFIRTLKRLCRKPQLQKNKPLKSVRSGYRAVYKGYVVLQDIIRCLIKFFDPEDVELRREHCLQCRHYHNKGPNIRCYDMWTHKKLKHTESPLTVFVTMLCG